MKRLTDKEINALYRLTDYARPRWSLNEARYVLESLVKLKLAKKHTTKALNYARPVIEYSITKKGLAVRQQLRDAYEALLHATRLKELAKNVSSGKRKPATYYGKLRSLMEDW